MSALFNNIYYAYKAAQDPCSSNWTIAAYAFKALLGDIGSVTLAAGGADLAGGASEAGGAADAGTGNAADGIGGTSEALSGQEIETTIRGLTKGSGRNVWTVGTDGEIDNLYDSLSRNGTPTRFASDPEENLKGEEVVLPDGTTVALRYGSGSGGVTIEVKIFGNKPVLKVHVASYQNAGA
jgi:hypothetical protein